MIRAPSCFHLQPSPKLCGGSGVSSSAGMEINCIGLLIDHSEIASFMGTIP